VWGLSLSPSLCGLKELSHVLIPKNRSTSKRFIIGNSFVVRFPRQFPELLIPHGLCDLSPSLFPVGKGAESECCILAIKVTLEERRRHTRGGKKVNVHGGRRKKEFNLTF
jgi:hypothetical protein